MVITSPPLHSNSRFCSVEADCLNQKKSRHYHHPTHPGESRESGDGSRGTDVDARINSLLRRKVHLPSFPGDHVHSRTSPTSRYANVQSSRRRADCRYDVDQSFAGIGLLPDDGDSRCRHSHLRGMDEQIAPPDVQAKTDYIANDARGTRPYIREASPKTFCGKARAVSAPFSASRVPGLAYAVAPESSFPATVAPSPACRKNFSANPSANVVHMNRESINHMSEGREAPSASDACRNTVDVNRRIDDVMKRTTDISQLMRTAYSYEVDSAVRRFLPYVARQPKSRSKPGDLGLEPCDVHDRPVSLDYTPSGSAIHSSSSIRSRVDQPSPTLTSHADPDACLLTASRGLPAGRHEPAMRNARSSSQAIGGNRSIERSCYNQVFHDSKQGGRHDQDGAPGGRPPHEDNTDRRIKNERVASILPSLEQVLDYVDEIASPVLPGMDILSYQRRREHLSVDDPLRCEIVQDECSKDVMFAGNDQSLSALPRLDPVVSPRNRTQSENRYYLSKSGIQSALEHRILQNANRESAFEGEIVRELRQSEGALLFLGGHSIQGARPPTGVYREGSGRRKDGGKCKSPIPPLEGIRINRESSSRSNDVRRSTSLLPHLEEVIEGKESSWPDCVGKATPPIPHLEEVVDDEESCSRDSIGKAAPPIPHLEEVIEDKVSSGRAITGNASPPIPHLEDVSMDQRPENLLKHEDGNFRPSLLQHKFDSFDEAESDLLRGNVEPSTDVPLVNGKDTVDFQTPWNLADGARILVRPRVKAVDPDAPLNRNLCAGGLGSDDDGSCRFPEHYDRYVCKEDKTASAHDAAAEKCTCDARDGAFATDFTMGETWPTQDDARSQTDEESLDFSLGRLDDSRTGSKFLVVAPETIATPINDVSREGSTAWMWNHTLREVSKMQEDPMTSLSQGVANGPRLPNGIPAFVLAKVKRLRVNNRKVHMSGSHDYELNTDTKVGPELSKIELTTTPTKIAPANVNSFVNQIILSIFGAGPAGADTFKWYFAERGYQWICCGESTTITIGNTLLDAGTNEVLPENSPFGRSSELLPSVINRSDMHLALGHDVGIIYEAKHAQVANLNAPRHSDLNDAVIIVDSPSDEWANAAGQEGRSIA